MSTGYTGCLFLTGREGKSDSLCKNLHHLKKKHPVDEKLRQSVATEARRLSIQLSTNAFEAQSTCYKQDKEPILRLCRQIVNWSGEHKSQQIEGKE